MLQNIFILWCSLLFLTMPLLADSYDFLLDASGSMRGFQKEGLTSKEITTKKCSAQESSGASWQNYLTNISKNSVNNYIFGDTFRKVEGIPLYKLCLKDKKTDLAGALSSWLNDNNSSDKLLIVTDNVSDTSNKSSFENQKYFKKLISGKSSKFSYVAVIAIRLPFMGYVYPLNDKHKIYYKGKRALVAYVLGKKGLSKNNFIKFRNSIEKKIENYKFKVFQVRPFSTESVKQTFGSVKFNNRETNNKVDIRPVKLKSGNTAIKVSNYTLGDKLQFTLDTSLEIKGAFLLKKIKLESDITFDALPSHITSIKQSKNSEDIKFNAKITPSPVTLTPNEAKGFLIEFKMDRFKFNDISFKNKAMYALSNTQDLRGNLDLRFKIEKEQYEIDNSVISEWSHQHSDKLGKDDISTQSKVYRLGDILETGIVENPTEENLKRIPLILEVRYNMGPIISSIILFLILLGVFYWLWLKSRKSQDYILTDDMGSQIPISIGIGQVYKHYDDQGQNLFNIRFLGLSYFVSSRFKLSGSRFLSTGQSFEIYDKFSETEQSFYLSQIEHSSQSSDIADSYDW